MTTSKAALNCSSPLLLGALIHHRRLLDLMLEMILDDIERSRLGKFYLDDVDIEVTHELIENEKDKAITQQMLESARKTNVDALLGVQHVLDEDTLLEQVACIHELNTDEIVKKSLQDYGTALATI